MSDLPAPPYPANTRAKGWRFELDYERIEQSDTWGLAADRPLAQACLLALWYVAWKQEPCGSLPDDLEVIRSKCRVPPEVWDSLHAILMRGWWKASDGRLYHDTLTARVHEMLTKRRADAARQAASRARLTSESGASHADVTCDTDRTPPDVQRESSTYHLPPTDSQQDKPVVNGRGKRAAGPPCPADVNPQVWADWLELRRKKRATASATVIEGARNEAAKAGMTFEAFLRVWVRRGSQGMEADWLKPHERPGAQVVPLNRQEAIEQRNRQVGDDWLAEQEALDATR